MILPYGAMYLEAITRTRILHRELRTLCVLSINYKTRMSFGDKMEDIEQRAKDAAAEGKKDVKNDWAQTKADAEKAKNEVDADIDKM